MVNPRWNNSKKNKHLVYELQIFGLQSVSTSTIKVAELKENRSDSGYFERKIHRGLHLQVAATCCFPLLTLICFYSTRNGQNQVVICDFAILFNNTPFIHMMRGEAALNISFFGINIKHLLSESNFDTEAP